MRQSVIIFFLGIFSFVELYSQQMYVSFDTERGIVCEHIVVKGETLYALAKNYQSSTAKIKAANTIHGDIIQPNDVITIVIDVNQLSLERKDGFKPVIYTVKPNETLFKIAHVIAKQSVAQLMRMNGKSDYIIQIGDQLILGYLGDKEESGLPVTHIEEFEELTINVTTDQLKSGLYTAEIGRDKSELENSIHKMKGLAYWENDGNDTPEFVVMHATAKVNSDIFLYNPMLRRRVRAKVVSQLPKNLYPSNVDVVISPSVALALGARDKKFLVEMSFEE